MTRLYAAPGHLCFQEYEDRLRRLNIYSLERCHLTFCWKDCFLEKIAPVSMAVDVTRARWSFFHATYGPGSAIEGKISLAHLSLDDRPDRLHELAALFSVPVKWIKAN